MRLNNGVSIHGLHPMMQIANAEANVIWDKFGQDLTVVMSIYQNENMYSCRRSCDYDAKGFPNENVAQQACNRLKNKLGEAYDIVFANDYIRCTYAPINSRLI